MESPSRRELERRHQTRGEEATRKIERRKLNRNRAPRAIVVNDHTERVVPRSHAPRTNGRFSNKRTEDPI